MERRLLHRVSYCGSRWIPKFIVLRNVLAWSRVVGDFVFGSARHLANQWLFGSSLKRRVVNQIAWRTRCLLKFEERFALCVPNRLLKRRLTFNAAVSSASAKRKRISGDIFEEIRTLLFWSGVLFLAVLLLKPMIVKHAWIFFLVVWWGAWTDWSLSLAFSFSCKHNFLRLSVNVALKRTDWWRRGFPAWWVKTVSPCECAWSLSVLARFRHESLIKVVVAWPRILFLILDQNVYIHLPWWPRKWAALRVNFVV